MVLIIVGLLAAGILVGQDLIKAAAVRAQIAQIQKYNTAANAFYQKYGGLPGDLSDPIATQFGFVSRGTLPGQGDGNGLLQGNCGGTCASGHAVAGGETVTFWTDLSTANMIDGSFTFDAETACLPVTTGTSSVSFQAYYPAAKLGNGNYVYLSSGMSPYTAFNVFLIGALVTIPAGCAADSINPGVTVSQAYNIDKKLDDGLPGTGIVFVSYNPNLTDYVANNSIGVAGASTTCYDNGSTPYGTFQYSMGQNNGAGVNCSPNIKLQAGSQ